MPARKVKGGTCLHPQTNNKTANNSKRLFMVVRYLFFPIFNSGQGEGRRIALAVFIFADGAPDHGLIVQGHDFPPLAVLDAVVNPTREKQAAVYVVFILRVGAGNPVIALLDVVNIVFALILPAVHLAVVILGMVTVPRM